MIVPLVIGCVIVLLIHRLLRKPFSYWTDRGVKQTNPVIIFGDKWRQISRQEALSDFIQRVYNLHSDCRYVGYYDFFTPALLLKDPDLIKQIAVKDHDHFMDHKSFVPEHSDPMWANNLFFLKGQKWKDMRATLSPAYTGSKMKQMFLLMCENAEQFTEYFLSQKDHVVTVELKDTFARFANDVIGNTAFGVKCNSLEDRNSEFYRMARNILNFKSIGFTIRFVFSVLFPTLYKFFKVRLFSNEVSGFFYTIVKENLALRDKNQIVRPDILTLLNEQRKHGPKHDESKETNVGFATVADHQDTTHGRHEKLHQLKNITDEDITAQVLLFFFAGFDSVSSLMCWIAYELAMNPEIQQRLRAEIEEAAEECNGQITYDVLVKLKYLDMVISETLRKWPPFPAIDRICTKDYVLIPQNPQEKPIHFLKGKGRVFLPIIAIHRDEKYYPEPLRFDPERFSDENKDKIKPYTYLPFGAGPRNCIGSRFALLETKILYYYLLLNFEIIPVEKTNLSFRLSPSSINTTAEGGYWFGFKQLNR